MCDICDTCKHKFILDRCVVSINDGELVELVDFDERRNNKNECEYYDKITINTKIERFISQKIYNIKMVYYNIRSFFKNNIYGRIKHGFNIEDTWELDVAIAKYIHPRVKYLADHTHGHPSLLSDGLFINNNDLSQYYSDDKFIMWQNILNEISRGFEDYIDDDNRKPPKESLRLISIFYECLWD